jgi:hypothetical protein
MIWKEAYFILLSRASRYIHRAGDILLRQLGEIKIRSLFLSIRF